MSRLARSEMRFFHWLTKIVEPHFRQVWIRENAWAAIGRREGQCHSQDSGVWQKNTRDPLMASRHLRRLTACNWEEHLNNPP